MRTAHFDVLIAGGGLAAQRCCETLRRHGFVGQRRGLCEEPCRPYDRPPLSKAILAADEEPRPSQLRCDEWYDQNEVELLLGVRACELDARGRSVSVAERRGRVSTLRFERLVIATGSSPRQLAGITPGGGVHELRTYEDALRLRLALREREGPTAIIGAGLIGMEVASSARSLGRQVTMIEAAERPLARALPPALGTMDRPLSPRVRGRRASVHNGSARPLSSRWNDAGAERRQPDQSEHRAARRRHRTCDGLARLQRAGRRRRDRGPSGSNRRSGHLCRGRRRVLDATPSSAGRWPASTGKPPRAREPPSLARSSVSRRCARHRRCSGAISMDTASSSSATPPTTASSSSWTSPPRVHRSQPGCTTAREPAPPCSSTARPRSVPRAGGSNSRNPPGTARWPHDGSASKATPNREVIEMACVPVIDEDACLAHGDCAEMIPSVFRVENTAVVIGSAPAETLLAVAEACPAGAILLIDDQSGEQIFP